MPDTTTRAIRALLSLNTGAFYAAPCYASLSVAQVQRGGGRVI